MSEYLYGQESFQQERETEDRGAEVIFFDCLHISAGRSVDMHFHYLALRLNRNLKAGKLVVIL